MVERVNARLKDEFGGRTVRVRGGGEGDGASDVWSAGADSGPDPETSAMIFTSQSTLNNSERRVFLTPYVVGWLYI